MRTALLGVTVVALAAAVVSGAAVFGLVWGLRAMAPDVPDEPEWPPSVETVETGRGYLTPGISFAVFVRLNDRDDDAVIRAAKYAVATKDPHGYGEVIRVRFAIDREYWTIDLPLPHEQELARELAEIPSPLEAVPDSKEKA